MISRSIAKRYAKGLFAVGDKNGKHRDYLKELEIILDLFDKEPRLRKALVLPLLEVQKRKELLSEVMRAFGASPVLSSLLNLLVEKNRMSYFPMIKDVYRELVDEKEGRVRGTLWTAYTLDTSVQQRVTEVLKKRLSKEVILEAIEDKSLIGGIRVAIQGTIIDGNVKKQLETLKENILKE